jgi:hypothetical protein
MSFYQGNHLSLLTKHSKETVIKPILEESVSCVVMPENGYDTDLLGTFTKEIDRYGTQIDAARRKAMIGMDLTGLSLGLGSEGSFGRDPMMGMFSWDFEIIVLVDRTNGLEIVGRAENKAKFVHETTNEWKTVESFAGRASFPGHGLVIRAEHEGMTEFHKGIRSWEGLTESFEKALRFSRGQPVWLENDLRAHMNPTRMGVIGAASRNLAEKIHSLCPQCGFPGFWAVKGIPGKPCSLCGGATGLIIREHYGCSKCGYGETRDLEGSEYADPRDCDYCNP